MRINSIYSYSKPNRSIKSTNSKRIQNVNAQNINFQGKVGSYLGIVAGITATAAIASVTAPVLITGAALGAVACGMAGDKFEDELRKNNKKDKK